MKNTLIVLVILISSFSYAQQEMEEKMEEEVFRYMVNTKITRGNYYLRCNKSKTFFDSENFNAVSAINESIELLKELEQKAEKSTDKKWNSKLIADVAKGSKFIKGKRCLTKREIDRLFRNQKERHTVFSVSQPIFDSTYNNCIVAISYKSHPKSGSGFSFFLKKVNGVWEVADIFGLWIN